MRVVLDINVFVSALINPVGTPGRVVVAALERRFTLVVCERLVTEVREVSERPRLRRFFTLDDAGELLSAISGVAESFADPVDAPSLARDPDDDFLVDLARSATAELVTGDPDLLELDLPDLVIRTPRDFLDTLENH